MCVCVSRYVDDVVSFFEGRNVTVSDDEFTNRAVTVIIAILVVSVVAYPVGVVLSRWAQGLVDCCCCPPCHDHSRRSECKKPPCPVHDEIMHIPAAAAAVDPLDDYHMTSINIDQLDNPCSAVILL